MRAKPAAQTPKVPLRAAPRPISSQRNAQKQLTTPTKTSPQLKLIKPRDPPPVERPKSGLGILGKAVETITVLF